MQGEQAEASDQTQLSDLLIKVPPDAGLPPTPACTRVTALAETLPAACTTSDQTHKMPSFTWSKSQTF